MSSYSMIGYIPIPCLMVKVVIEYLIVNYNSEIIVKFNELYNYAFKTAVG